MSPRHSSFSLSAFEFRRRTAAIGAALTLGLCGAARADVDVVALAMVGPGQAHVDSEVIVSIQLAKFGVDPAPMFTAQAVLSTDPIVDAADVLVASVTSDMIGYHSLTAYVPAGLPAGKYFWGFRILPVPGETSGTNNAVIGTEVNILRTDLELDDPTPVHFFYSPSLNEVPHADVVVSNVGSINSIVVFTIETTNPTPWLHIDAPSSFAVAGQDGNVVTLTPVIDGLPLGVYQTTVRFQNVYTVDDFTTLDVTLTVGPVILNPGDSVVGDIASPSDEDRLLVEVVEGERVMFNARGRSGDLALQLSFVDPDGQPEGELTWKHTGKFTQQKYKFARSGIYTIVISGKDDTTGAYQMKTARKLPKKARPRTVTVTAAAPAVEVLTLNGAILDFGITPLTGFIGPILVNCESPTGTALDLVGHTKPGPSAGVHVESLTVTENGMHQVIVEGFGTDPGASAEVSIYPIQPKIGHEKIYLP